MTSHSPKSSPTFHVNKWSEQQVADWLSTVGLSKYGRDFKSNGITGDVLVLLDDEALKDIGVVTIGQRLALLSGIYRLKQQYGIPVQEGDWVPKAVEAQEHASNALTTAHMAGALRQRDDRIRLLESQILRLADYLARFQQDMASVARHVGVKAHSIDTPITLVSNSLHSHHSSESSLTSMTGYGSNSDLASTAASSLPLESPTSRNFAGLVSPTRTGFTYPAGHAMSGFKPATVTSQNSDSISGHSPMTPTTAAHSYAANSTNVAGPADLSPTQPTPSATPTSLTSQPSFPTQLPYQYQQQPPSSAGSTSMVSPTRRLAHQNSISQPDSAGSSRPRAGSLGGPAPHGVFNGTSPFASSSTNYNSANSSSAASSSATEREDRNEPAAAVATASTEPKARSPAATGTSSSSSTSAAASANNSGSSDSNPYKSFRVTLDDPCYKVLPAALKKYKINDDWRKYALFICYGKTERCLSYDEKPLLLFQKLKENEQSPVFMLRHIRDVKSPIAIAEAKAVSKLQEREGEGAASAKKRSAPRADRRRIIAGTPPPGAVVTNASNPVEVGPAAELPERNKVTKTYAVAIYPYMPERDDEFDVNVGDTFVVINKAKGWWIVQRTPRVTVQEMWCTAYPQARRALAKTMVSLTRTIEQSTLPDGYQQDVCWRRASRWAASSLRARPCLRRDLGRAPFRILVRPRSALSRSMQSEPPSRPHISQAPVRQVSCSWTIRAQRVILIFEKMNGYACSSGTTTGLIAYRNVMGMQEVGSQLVYRQAFVVCIR